MASDAPLLMGHSVMAFNIGLSPILYSKENTKEMGDGGVGELGLERGQVGQQWCMINLNPLPGTNQLSQVHVDLHQLQSA